MDADSGRLQSLANNRLQSSLLELLRLTTTNPPQTTGAVQTANVFLTGSSPRGPARVVVIVVLLSGNQRRYFKESPSDRSL